MTDASQGVILVGEAAKSWVTLQWIKWASSEAIFWIIIVGCILIIRALWIAHKEILAEEERKERK